MSLRTHLLVLGAALAWGAGSARAVCTAEEIISQEPLSCPAGGIVCSISKQYSIEDGCTLDFGGRDVTLQPSSLLTVGTRSFTLRARTVNLLGRIAGRAIGTSAAGGMVTIETSGDLTIGASGTIDVSGTGNGGVIIANVGGSALIGGKLLAKNSTGAAGGGLISVTAAGNISDTNAAAIDAEGGIDSNGGGEIDLVAGGDLTLVSTPSVFGYDGGYIALEAGGKATIGSAKASGRGDAGSGGCVDLFAGAGVEINGRIDANGHGGSFMTGGCGGLICIDGGLGDTRLAVGAAVNADGASPDGGGGQVALTARGNVIVSGTVTARGPSGETCGGDVCIDAGYDMQLPGTGSLDVSGGDAGGDLEINAGRSLSASALVDASGRQAGSLGGSITLRAGATGSGSLTVAGTIDVSSRGTCGGQNDCGQGGISDLSGCDVTVNGTILASGPNGGENLVTARDVLRSFGMIDATRTVETEIIGENRLVHRIDRPPTVNAAGINPAAVLVPVETCTAGDTDPFCLMPCPVCGNGVVEFPETCDNGMMPPRSCSGCSAFCQSENCDDNRVCTADSCDVMFGCLNQPTPNCQEPTATVTGTLPTATATPTPSQTPNASATPTVTPTASPSLTPAASQTAAPTATGIDTATPSASSTATETPTHEPTVTAPPGCPGDCNGVGGVTVNELILGVNIALGNTGAGVCPAFDGDASGTVSISELIAAVNAALNGC